MSRWGEKLLARLTKKGEAILAWMAWQFMPRPRLDIFLSNMECVFSVYLASGFEIFEIRCADAVS